MDEETGREENHAESRRRRGQREDTEEDASRYCIFFLFFYTLFSLLLLFSFFFAWPRPQCVHVCEWLLLSGCGCLFEFIKFRIMQTLRISWSYFRCFLYFYVLLRVLRNECIKHAQSLVVVAREERNASSRTPMHDRISSFRCRNHVNVINNTLTA